MVYFFCIFWPKAKNMVHTEQVLNVELLWWNKNAPFDTEILLTHKQSLKDTYIGL